MKKTILQLLKINLLILTLIPFSLLPYDQEFVKKINTKYLQTFGDRTETTRAPVEDSKTFWDHVSSPFKPNQFTSPDFTPYEISELLSKATETLPTRSENVVSSTTVHKMDLICGSGKKSNAHVASYLSTIFSDNNEQSLLQTHSGSLALVKNISQPHTDVDALTKRQQAIKLCASDKKLTDKLTNTLQAIGTGEKKLVSYFKENVIIQAELLKKVYWQNFLLKSLNKSVDGLELGTRASNALDLFGLTGLEIELLTMRAFFGQDVFSMMFSIRTIAMLELFFAPPKLSIIGQVKIKKNITNLLQTQLIGVASYVNGAKELYRTLSKYPNAMQNFSQLETLKALVVPSKKHSAEFDELIELLSTNTFKGDASFFSISGRVLRAHTLMSTESVQKEFAEIINAVGELDVYVALARKINASQGTNAPYSFVEFDTESTIPYIKAQGLWNPFVPESKAVGNTLELGRNKPRNIILSGPNTGGKSTYGKSGLISAILAQAFGIVAAEYMIMTPFKNLDCYLNMTDDTASGLSGLKAEVVRAKELIEKIKQTNGFNFILLDEIFTATSPDQAEKLAVEFITKLSELDNCLFIDAAHFEGLIQFAERSPHCRNCHMGALTDNQGKVLKYTYLLGEGRSHIKNAQQVAEESFSFN